MDYEKEIEYLGKKYKLKNTEDSFRFTCDKCGNCCGNDIVIMLNPYDIIRICKNKNITTSEFLKQYCYLFIGKDSKFPIVALKTSPKCIFNIDRLCSIYEDRPLRCRMYPIGRAVMHNIEGNSNKEKFFVEENCSKTPFRLQRIQTIQKWLDEQNVNKYLEMSSKWIEIVIRWVKLKLPEMDSLNNVIIGISYDFDKSKVINNVEDIDEKYNIVLESLNKILDMCEKIKEGLG